MLLTNTSWGRSNLAAAERVAQDRDMPQVSSIAWYNWQERSLVDKYLKLVQSGAQAVVLVANDDEAAMLVREMSALLPEQRLPVLSHWGVTGGRFVQEAGAALAQVDFSVIQTFSFLRARGPVLDAFLATARQQGVQRVEDIESPVGVAHAFDMTHILARALALAGSTDRGAVRDALEKVPRHDGLIKRYAPPFTATRHEALGPAELLMARYRADGVLQPVA
ncbi:ABC transporter substrate-binding protein [Aquabacterium sp. J223]|nr:ABC transporter substrate-binding protein [Aquabacterium sp. J223]UUX97768.1 ABC transporter substrate-binding protein [Aquabacterium sp. J223]